MLATGAPRRRPPSHLATTCRWRRPRPAARGGLDLHLQMDGTSGRKERGNMRLLLPAVFNRGLVYRRSHPTFLQWSTWSPQRAMWIGHRRPEQGTSQTTLQPSPRVNGSLPPLLRLPNEAAGQRLPHHRVASYRCRFTAAPQRSSMPPPAIQVRGPWRFTTAAPLKSHSCHAQMRKAKKRTSPKTRKKLSTDARRCPLYYPTDEVNQGAGGFVRLKHQHKKICFGSL